MDDKSVSLYDETQPRVPSSFMVEADTRLFAGIVLWGALMGAFVAGLALFLKQFVVEPFFCQSIDAFALCSSGGGIAFNTATVIMGVVGTIGLVRMSTYRPLPIAAAAAISLWGAHSWLAGLQWYETLAWLVVLYGLAYGVFAWVLRIYNFSVALILSVVLVVAARVVLQL